MTLVPVSISNLNYIYNAYVDPPYNGYVINYNSGIYMSANASVLDCEAGLYCMQVLPITPYTAISHMINQGSYGIKQAYGMCIAEAPITTMSKFIIFGQQTNGSSNNNLIITQRWSNFEAHQDSYLDIPNVLSNSSWFKIIDNGATFNFCHSNDGLHWTTHYTIDRTNWLVPAYIGVFGNLKNQGLSLFIDSWQIS